MFAPIGGWSIDRIGARFVILGCLATIVAGLIGTVFVQELWQLILLWGVVLAARLVFDHEPRLDPGVEISATCDETLRLSLLSW